MSAVRHDHPLRHARLSRRGEEPSSKAVAGVAVDVEADHSRCFARRVVAQAMNHLVVEMRQRRELDRSLRWMNRDDPGNGTRSGVSRHSSKGSKSVCVTR